ncbi:MAG: aminotransferase class V-fold PLP-dependent enzyme [Candidatus Gracilibacteria bacterium]
MSPQYFTPGPTMHYPKLYEFLEDAKRDHIFSISHRSPAFHDIFRASQENLKKLLNIPEDFHIFFLGSATEAMERLIENCVEKTSVHFVNGAFSKRMYDCAVELQKEPVIYTASLGEGFHFPSYDLPENTELITMSHCETSGCVMAPLEEIYALKAKYPNALIALDIVTTAPYAEIDFSKIDSVFFSIQKGFGLPAGMGVLVINEKCLEKSRKLQSKGLSIGTYHNFPNLAHYEALFSTPETPNILGIYLLGKVASDMLSNLPSIRKDIKIKADLMYTFLDHSPVLHSLVQNKTWRSDTVFGIATPWGSSHLMEYAKSHNFIVGSGYGEDKDKLIRIANFPMHSVSATKELINVLRDFSI